MNAEMRRHGTTPDRYLPAQIVEEEERVHTLKTTPTYSEVEASPVPFTVGSYSTPTSPSAVTGATDRRLHTTRKTFARSVARAMNVTERPALALSNAASSPASHTKLQSTPTTQSSQMHGSPAPVRSIFDFFLGSSASPPEPTECLASNSTERRGLEVEKPTGGLTSTDHSLSWSHDLGPFRRSLAPARTFIEDFLATTDEHRIDKPPEEWTSPPTRDNHNTALDFTSPPVRIVGVALDNTPVVPEMWEETSSSLSTSSTSASDVFERMKETRQPQRSGFVSHMHLGSASPSSPHPAPLTASPTKWLRGGVSAPSPLKSSICAPNQSVPMIDGKQAVSLLTGGKGALSATVSAEDTTIHQHKRNRRLPNRTGDEGFREAVERELHFPPCTPQQEGAQATSTSWRAAPVASDGMNSACNPPNRPRRSPFSALPRSSLSVHQFLTPPSVDVERNAPMSFCGSPQEGVHRGMWGGCLGGGGLAAHEAARADMMPPPQAAASNPPGEVPLALSRPCAMAQRDLPQTPAHRSVNGGAASFHTVRQILEPHLTQHVEIQGGTIDLCEPHRCASKKPNVRALLARLHPGRCPSTHSQASAKMGSAANECASQMTLLVKDAPPPRWNVSTKVHYNPLTESIELDPTKKHSSSARRGRPSWTNDDRVEKRSIASYPSRSGSAPVKVPLHTRTSLLRLEATRAHKAAEAALREEMESPSFHPTVAPNSVRICRNKLRELKSSKNAGLTGTGQGSHQERASHTEKLRGDSKAWLGRPERDTFWGDAAVLEDISVSSTDNADEPMSPQQTSLSGSLAASPPAEDAASLQIADFRSPGANVSTQVRVEKVKAPARRQARQQQRIQERRGNEQLEVQRDQERTGQSNATRLPMEIPRCVEPRRPPASSLTDHTNTPTQCSLLSIEDAVTPVMLTGHGSAVKRGATLVPPSETDVPTPRSERMATQAPLQRVDLYSTAPSAELEVRDTWLGRQQRLEERLLALHRDRLRRQTMFGHLPKMRELVTQQPFFKPFTGR